MLSMVAEGVVLVAVRIVAAAQTAPQATTAEVLYLVLLEVAAEVLVFYGQPTLKEMAEGAVLGVHIPLVVLVEQEERREVQGVQEERQVLARMGLVENLVAATAEAVAEVARVLPLESEGQEVYQAVAAEGQVEMMALVVVAQAATEAKAR